MWCSGAAVADHVGTYDAIVEGEKMGNQVAKSEGEVGPAMNLCRARVRISRGEAEKGGWKIGDGSRGCCIKYGMNQEKVPEKWSI